MKTQIVLVTPEMARKWLEGPMHNRPLRQSVVDKYAAILAAKKWKLTHQGIAFDDDGRLIDGQHRLFAIWNSGISAQMMVTWGLSPDVQSVIDDGAKRTVIDVARLTRTLTDATGRHAAAARVMLIHGTGFDNDMVTNQVMIDFLKRYWDSISFAVTEVFHGGGVRGVTAAPVVAVVAQAHAAGANQDRLREFGAVLLKGAKDDGTVDRRDSAATLLSRWLLNRRANSKGLSIGQGMIYRRTQRALWSFLRGEPLDKLYEAREPLFPLPENHRRQQRRAAR